MRSSIKPVCAPLALAACLAVVACSDARTPSDDAFRKALEPVVADAFCRALPLGRIQREGAPDDEAFPLIVPVEPFRFDNQPPRGPVLAVLDEAARAGLLTRTEGETLGRQEGFDEPASRRRTISYAPTDDGKAYFRGVVGRTYGGGERVFPNVCLAKGEIVDVVRWTEPADLGGRRMSQITYSYRGVDPIPVGPPAERAKVGEARERTVTMELTNEGWRVLPR
ncbi:MAG: hypothetical protein PGN23_06665 [Sphingomonas adhaesiva]|uniref:hypothetical protein n=1 Tax=Sphingomonas adhaesiva TaxID=28212 RepID=UPI002FFC5A4F